MYSLQPSPHSSFLHFQSQSFSQDHYSQQKRDPLRLINEVKWSRRYDKCLVQPELRIQRCDCKCCLLESLVLETVSIAMYGFAAYCLSFFLCFIYLQSWGKCHSLSGIEHFKRWCYRHLFIFCFSFLLLYQFHPKYPSLPHAKRFRDWFRTIIAV